MRDLLRGLLPIKMPTLEVSFWKDINLLNESFRDGRLYGSHPQTADFFKSSICRIRFKYVQYVGPPTSKTAFLKLEDRKPFKMFPGPECLSIEESLLYPLNILGISIRHDFERYVTLPEVFHGLKNSQQAFLL